VGAKEEILQRIRNANVSETTAHRLTNEKAVSKSSEIVDRFAEFAADYKASVSRLRLEELSAAISALITESDRVLVPPDLSKQWLPSNQPFSSDEDFSTATLDGFTVVITGCACAIAETGTIVLDAGHTQGRRALSLIPDHHICVVFEDQVVESVPQAISDLRGAIDAGQPLTLISGPSATSDIELSRVEGVHGPRNLDILIVARDH
jgi:L-lactate dehydrogenase complex protein LldG